MDFKDSIKQLSERVISLKEQIKTEEATKNAFIMPFIQMLGYDVFNPMEVVPEMDCDLTKKKGEKIDYAIMKDNEPIMLIECKHWQQDLDLHNTQLAKYFVASKARFGVLTNGIQYRFYTDLVKPNIMDEVPFLEFDLEHLKDVQIEEVKKFHKSYFDIENIMSAASDLKFMYSLSSAIKEEFSSPSPEFVKFFAKKVYDGMINHKLLDQFTDVIQKAIALYINDTISERLNVAFNTGSTQVKSTEEVDVEPGKEESAEKEKPEIVTTAEELQGYYITKAILSSVVSMDRITYRDAKSYFSIFLDDNNRKPICRLYFNTFNKQLGLFDADKNETKVKIASLDDIFNYSDQLKQSIEKYLES